MPPRLSLLQTRFLRPSTATREASCVPWTCQRRWNSERKQRNFYHFWGDGPGGLVKYEDAEKLQDIYRDRFLKWKALPSDERESTPRPHNTVIAFECEPTFTLGRRQKDISLDSQTILTQELPVDLPHRHETLKSTFTPIVKHTLRGGLTTYHGPGQLVLWPVVDMHGGIGHNFKRLTVESYANCLQEATQQLLADLFSIETFTDADEPGVWVKNPDPSGPPRKIAALGVHHRRYITSLGTAINIDVPVIGGPDVNPWARFVPCGLEGKEVTSVARELGQTPIEGWNMGFYSAYWTKKFAEITKLWKVGGD